MDFEKFLSDMSFNSSFRLLEEGKDSTKLMEIAKSSGLVLPAHDISVFECVYAFTDRQNKNGCTLPKDEVEKALATLKGKSIDLDHNRKTVVGYWIEGRLVENQIIAYGAIWKGSFEQDFDIIKELFSKGNLNVSFEAWGNRIKNDTGYDLTDIEFAGGALLIKTEPAFDGAGVLEMAKNRVLELASVMKANTPKTFVREYGTSLHKDSDADTGKAELARMYVSDMDHIMRNLHEVDCASCGESMLDPTYIDYGKNEAGVECSSCGSKMVVAMTPAVTLTKKGRKIKAINQYVQKPSSTSASELAAFINDPDLSGERVELALEEVLIGLPKMDNSSRFELSDEDFAIVKNVEVEKGKNKKIRVLPIPDLAHIRLAHVVIEQAQTKELLNQLSISQDTVNRKITRKVVTLAMKNLMKKYNVATAVEAIQALSKEKIGREMTTEELEKAYSIVAIKAGISGDGQVATGQPGYGITALPKGKSAWNDTSIMDVTLSDNEYHSLVEKATTKDDEMEKAELQKKLDEANAKLAEVSTKLTALETEKAAAEKVKKDELVKARRTELTEAYAKDMKDEEILDDTKFELAKLKKENAELKSGKKAPVKSMVDLAKGTVKEVGSTVDQTPEQASRAKIDSMAWASRNRKKPSEQTDE